jgi:hypothetical protein
MGVRIPEVLGQCQRETGLLEPFVEEGGVADRLDDHVVDVHLGRRIVQCGGLGLGPARQLPSPDQRVVEHQLTAEGGE